MIEFKAGDRCEVFGTGTSGDGATLTILSKAPNKAFTLPNGQKHSRPFTDGAYVVELDAPVAAPMMVGKLLTNQFQTRYGVVDGDKMRLIDAAMTAPPATEGEA